MIYELNNLKAINEEYKSFFKEDDCHNNCKIVYEILKGKKIIDESAVIVGGWLCKIEEKGIGTTHHFSIYHNEKFYDILDGHFHPLFKLDIDNWVKDEARLTMCSYYHSNPLNILKDIDFLFDFIYNKYWNGSPTEIHEKAFEKMKVDTIQNIYATTTDFNLTYHDSSRFAFSNLSPNIEKNHLGIKKYIDYIEKF